MEFTDIQITGKSNFGELPPMEFTIPLNFTPTDWMEFTRMMKQAMVHFAKLPDDLVQFKDDTLHEEGMIFIESGTDEDLTVA